VGRAWAKAWDAEAQHEALEATVTEHHTDAAMDPATVLAYLPVLGRQVEEAASDSRALAELPALLRRAADEIDCAIIHWLHGGSLAPAEAEE
jgi:hypothetical protein